MSEPGVSRTPNQYRGAGRTAEFFAVAQVAARWGCSRTVVYDEIRANRLRALTIVSHGKRVSTAELERYERERTGVAP